LIQKDSGHAFGPRKCLGGRLAKKNAGLGLNTGAHAMGSPIVSAVLVASFVLTPVAAGFTPALSQDFSITNQTEPADPGRRDLMRQLQAWWEVHAYYPRHASNNDEAGTVKIHLNILPDGRIWMLNVVESSGSNALDTASLSAFRGGTVRPFPEGAPEANVDISLHYVLAHRHDQAVPASYTPVVSKSRFTITNDPVKSPILETMLQRICTGTATRNGSRTRTWQGMHGSAQAIFFRKPDGTPWVKFYEGGQSVTSPVTQLGNMLQWAGRTEHHGSQGFWSTQWTVWSDGANHLSGAEGSPIITTNGSIYNTGLGGPVDLTCATEVLPTVSYSSLSSQTMFTPPGDPP
jgi:TonB family protein